MEPSRGSGLIPRWVYQIVEYFIVLIGIQTQVTIEYKHDNGAVIPLRVDTVVVSAQHSEDISLEDLRSEIMEKIVKKVIPENMRDDKTVYHVS